MYDIWDNLYGDQSDYQQFLLNRYPEMEDWFPNELFNKPVKWPDNVGLKVVRGTCNVSGKFIADNLETSTTLIEAPATPEIIITELQRAKNKNSPYTHVGFSVFIDAYTIFVKCAKTVKEFDPKIITIAGNSGALYDETIKHVDYVCKTDGILYLRKVLGEDIEKSYQLKLIPSKNTLKFFGIAVKTEIVQIVTKLGCPQKCDFCIINRLFEGNVTSAFFTPEHVHKTLVAYRTKIKIDFKIAFCEPTSIISHNWWYKLFKLFENEPEDYPLLIGTTAISLENFDFNRVRNSSLRFEMINIGVENFHKQYSKNKNINIKKLFKRLADYGIGAYATYIIGFDHHNHYNIWEEINKLLDLDAALNYVENLKILPQTPLWFKYKKDGRLFEIPKDFFFIDGFQSFKHPHFKPGFEDMLPLLTEIQIYIEKERGPQGIDMLRILNNIPNPKKNVLNQIKYLKMATKLLFPSWKKYLNPNDKQIENYLAKMGAMVKIPYYINLLTKSSRLRKLANYFIK
jgi:hypothetical protein